MAILVNGEVIGIIELKDTKTINLKQVEAQAFGYKTTIGKQSMLIPPTLKTTFLHK